MTISTQQRRRRAGFTLVEVLLVLAILVIIGSLVVGNYVRIQRNAERSAARTQIAAFKTPIQTYRMDVGYFPSTLEALVEPPPDLVNPIRWKGPYLEGGILPYDPWGNPYQYAYPGSYMGEDYPDIWSFGPNGIDGDDDDVGNWLEE
jgi:general secretion pathway protein G